MQKRFLSIILALSFLLVPVIALADEEKSELAIQGGGDLTSVEKPTLKAEGGESGYQWYRNEEEIKRPLSNKEIDALDKTEAEKSQLKALAAQERAALAAAGYEFEDDGGSRLTTNRSGDYYVASGNSKSGAVRVYREFDNRGSSGLLIGKRSNKLTDRKDSQIEKLEARVAQAVEDAAKPLPTVSLGMVYNAVNTAASSGTVATLTDAGMLELDQQRVLMRRINEAGLSDRLFADQIVDRKVVTRLCLTPSRINSSIHLGLSLGDEELTAFFENAFSNRLLVVEAAQQGAYGQSVEMIVDGTALLGTRSLSFYRYDDDTGNCVPISVAGVSFDEKGYLHFRISSGGILVISEGDLAAKA